MRYPVSRCGVMRLAILITMGAMGALPSRAADLAYWRFDGLNANGEVQDEAGSAHLKPNAAAVFQPGLYGEAALLVQGRPLFSTPSQKSISLIDDFTITCAIRPDWVKFYNVIAWKGDRSTQPEAISYYLGIRDGRLEFKYKDRQGRWLIHTAPTRLAVGEWYEVGVHFKQGAVEMVINGVPQKLKAPEGGASPVALVPNEAPLEVGEGAKPLSRSFQFSGLLDDLRFSEGRTLLVGPQEAKAHQQRVAAYREREARYKAEEKARAERLAAQRKADYEAYFNEDGTGAPFLVRVLPVARRINKHDGFLSDIKTADERISLRAARNEYEGIQLIVAGNPHDDATGVEIVVDDLISDEGGVLPASRASWGWIKAVKTESSGVPVDFIGEIPDVVMDGLGKFSVKAGGFTPALIRWYVAPETRPGTYRGTVTVKNGDGARKVPVEFRVYGFELPKVNSIPVAFSFFEAYYKDWYQLKELSDEQKLAIYEFLLSYRVSPNNIYSDDVYPEFHLLEKIKDRVNFVTIGSWGKAANSQAAQKRVDEFRDRLERLEAMGLKKAAYFYGVDELKDDVPNRLPRAVEAHRYLHRNFPDLRTMQTSFPKEPYEHLFNVWVPYISFFSKPESLKKLEELKANGCEIWWYVADGPPKPFPNFFVDFPPFDSRVFLMLSYRYKVDGILYWAINREWVTNMEIRQAWPDAEWKPYINHISEGTKKERNGMGNFIYPGPEGRMLPSLRLENLRDGIEDYEYLTLLKKEIEAAAQRGIDGALLAEARELEEVPQEVVVAVDNYNTDPSALMRYRDKVGAMIEALKGEQR